MVTIVASNPRKDAEVAQVLTVTHREPEDAHGQRHILLIVIQCDDDIVERTDNVLDVVVELDTVDVHIMQSDGSGIVIILVVVFHLVGHGRRVNGKQTGQLLDVLIDDVAMESGSIHPHVVTARADKRPELIEEPYRIIAHLAKTDNKRVEIR